SLTGRPPARRPAAAGGPAERRLAGATMHNDTTQYDAALASPHREVCELLAREIDAGLEGAANKVWHGHPVWFLDDNPIVGYSLEKKGVRLMFWSGADFDEPALRSEERRVGRESR